MNLDNPVLLTQPLSFEPNEKERDFGADWTSSLLPDSSAGGMLPERLQLEDDTGLELDLGEDDPIGHDTSIEIGRKPPPARPIGEDLFSDDNKLQDGDDLDLDLGEDVPSGGRMDVGMPNAHDNIDNFLGVDEDMGIGGGDDFDFRDTERDAPVQVAQPGRPQRESQSPLSSARSSLARDFDQTFVQQDGEEEASARQAQKAKKRKLLQPDADTVLHNHQIKAQQADRSKILKPLSFLPRDPVLLTLMNMQKNGDFVSSVMGDGRGRGWAPELRGILSIDVVRRSGELKRKRDSRIADLDEEDVAGHAEKTPRLELGEEDGFLPIDEGLGLDGDASRMHQSEIEIPADEGMRPLTSDGLDVGNVRAGQESDDEGMYPGMDDFDDTTAPLVHPADSGPVSLGTKHAVHLLRDRFGGLAIDSPSQQKKSSVLFQDLLPERQTSKIDATKMFFEVLVLATKDAVKVEQSEKSIGGPLRIRGKRGLWGDWAETEAGGEIAAQGIEAGVGAVES